MRASVGKSALWATGLVPLLLVIQSCTGTSDDKPSSGGSAGAEAPGGSAGDTISLGGSAARGGASDGGSLSAAGEAAAGANSMGGAQDSGGALGHGGSAGSHGGSAGSSGSGCPSAVPQDGASCTAAMNCIYLDCSGRGRVSASCDGHAFAVAAVACSDIVDHCGLSDCAAGQVCLEQYSGTFQRACSANPCGTHAIGCECAASLCPGGWACSTQGITVRCSSPCTTCP